MAAAAAEAAADLAAAYDTSGFDLIEEPEASQGGEEGQQPLQVRTDTAANLMALDLAEGGDYEDGGDGFDGAELATLGGDGIAAAEARAGGGPLGSLSLPTLRPLGASTPPMVGEGPGEDLLQQAGARKPAGRPAKALRAAGGGAKAVAAAAAPGRAPAAAKPPQRLNSLPAMGAAGAAAAKPPERLRSLPALGTLGGGGMAFGGSRFTGMADLQQSPGLDVGDDYAAPSPQSDTNTTPSAPLGRGPRQRLMPLSFGGGQEGMAGGDTLPGVAALQAPAGRARTAGQQSRRGRPTIYEVGAHWVACRWEGYPSISFCWLQPAWRCQLMLRTPASALHYMTSCCAADHLGCHAHADCPSVAALLLPGGGCRWRRTPRRRMAARRP